ncbi:cell envelope integrity protein TolA [Desulfovibrio sp. JC010]|uniref:cell envelope integrity protein TolA n=1 Tax=Desulfovibrio sp. JC010 TaxID=2593641 RepID=UPI0013D82CB0|nr:cell envelope integrity protein TolA [Desulfovibrio sp. JC010]NDV28458.1 cell envelope integrity protein TolA [Desulfovibrio sp. JC010]
MKIIGLFISLLLHAGLILLALTWTVSPPVKISLDMPVYKVDLVSLAPLPAAPAVKKAPAPKAASKLSKPNAVAIPAAKPKAAPKVKPESTKAPAPKPAPKPKAKPKPKPDTKKISPKKVKTTAKKKPVKKVEKKAPPKTAEPKKPETKKVAKKTPPKKVEKKVEKKPEVSAEDALAADLAALTKMVEKQEKAERQAVASDLASLSKSAKATAVTGSADGTAGASGLVQVYASIVKEAVRKNWRYPVFGQKQNLMARVQIQLKSNGEISDIKLLDSSGNVDFDDSVMTALRDTEVLPEPPGTSIRTLVVNFNLHDLDQ